jgi:CheY-like chemotaxis protein
METSDQASVLLVEDDQDDELVIRHAFDRAGIDCAVRVVADGEEAIAYLKGEGIYQDRNTYPLPMVILIDLRLPRKSGHEVLAWMKQQKQLDSMMRVVLTGSENPQDVTKAYQLGAHGYLQKPLTPEQLTQPGRNLRNILTGNRAHLRD